MFNNKHNPRRGSKLQMLIGMVAAKYEKSAYPKGQSQKLPYWKGYFNALRILFLKKFYL